MSLDGIYGIVRNIPSRFHSSELRNFFSDGIENKKFKCFHFKHRPEIKKFLNKELDSKLISSKTTCGVFEANSLEDLKDIMLKYNDTHWIDGNGDSLKTKCFIDKIHITAYKRDKDKYFTRKEIEHDKRHSKSEEFCISDFQTLSEIRPPRHVMPQGNVGTSTATFLKLIKECSLPPKIIKKLKLTFPTTGSSRRYGNVPHVYDSNEKVFIPTQTYTATGEAIRSQTNADNTETKLKNEQNATDSSSDDDDDGGEEWERHEALHTDVTSQERIKERLFEENIELKWEKGGSGLVFYTDAQYWAEENKDFDLDTADDWDVDMSVYYGEKGDMDAQDLLDIRNNERLRHGLPVVSRMDRFTKKKPEKRSAAECKRMGDFEAHTKGVGRKLMIKYGWTDGNPLGVNRNEDAIKEPVEADGQKPRERKGFGYRGEKLRTRNDPNHRIHEPFASHSYNFPQFVQNASSKVNQDIYNEKKRKKLLPVVDGIIITTDKDGPLDVDGHDDVYRSQHEGSIKHRNKVESTKQSLTSSPSRPDVVYSGSKLVNHVTKSNV